MERDAVAVDKDGKKFISTHTLTWSVTSRAEIGGRQRCHFNSHAHVERDQTQSEMYDLMRISTHTLTWSVTQKWQKIVTYIWISTHTLTWSVTLDVVYIWCLLNVMRTYFFI